LILKKYFKNSLNHLHSGCVYGNVANEKFRCSFRVGREVLLAARLEQRPQVGRVALLSALVKAYKPRHREGRTQVRPFAFLTDANSALIGPKKDYASRRMKHQLDFEKPIIELQTKLDELRQHPEKHSLGISFEEEIQLIQKNWKKPGGRFS
jgi:hypothetical protein